MAGTQRLLQPGVSGNRGALAETDADADADADADTDTDADADADAGQGLQEFALQLVQERS